MFFIIISDIFLNIFIICYHFIQSGHNSGLVNLLLPPRITFFVLAFPFPFPLIRFLERNFLFVAISVYLLINPEVLTGLPFIKYKLIESSIVQNESNKIPFIALDYSKEINMLEGYLENYKPYLAYNFNISQLAVALNLPVRDLSYIINNNFDYVSYKKCIKIKNMNLNILYDMILELI